MFGNLPVRFCGTGSYYPEEVVTNEHFASYLDTSDEWIVSRTGIRERRRAAPHEATSDLAANAAKLAIEDAGISAQEIGLIICATATGDCPFPSTAAFVQNHLGIRNGAAFDVSAACAGFLHALCLGGHLLAAGNFQYALIIGAETLSRFVDPQDRGTVFLFGDGSGAAVIGKSDNPEQAILYSDLGCDGRHTEHIWVPAGGSRLPASATTVAERLHFMHMKGREVYKFAVNKMQELIDHALTVTGLTPDDLKLVVPHQSNLRIIESVRQKMGLSHDKILVNIDRFGNTSAASVITGIDEARRAGTIQQGDLVLMVAIGAGLSWGTAIVRF